MRPWRRERRGLRGRDRRALDVVADSNLLINFVKLGRLDLLERLPRYTFWVPDHVRREVHRRWQRQSLVRALARGALQPLEIVNLAEIALYQGYRHVVGDGESACLAVAVHRRWIIGTDEKRRVRSLVIEALGEGHILNTLGVLVRSFQAHLITQEESQRLLAQLSRIGFEVGFDSFEDTLRDWST